MATTNPARGTRDLLPLDVRKREYVIGIIKSVYESYGYEPLETPAVENLETLTGKYGEEGNQLMFKILKRGEKLDLENAGSVKDLADLALRYDLTVPLARVIANRRNDLPKFFKRYQIQPVWRADRPAKGRYREFYQCDVDAVGSASILLEAEQISAVSRILTRLGFGDFVVRINHRELLRDLLDTAGIPESHHMEALIAIDKLDKIGADGVAADLESRGIDEKAALMILELFEQSRLITEQGGDANRTIVSNLINIVRPEVLANLGSIIRFSDAPVVIDPSLARGLSYYTGAIMEVNVPDLSGSLAGGGRYDGLIGMFGKEQIPACGFSLGLERILIVMDERKMFPAEVEATSADAMVTIWNEDSIGDSLTLANELRKEGLRVLLYPEPDKIGKQIKYADSIGVPFVCLLGESELAENRVTVKNMQTGTQETLDRNSVAENILSA